MTNDRCDDKWQLGLLTTDIEVINIYRVSTTVILSIFTL